MTVRSLAIAALAGTVFLGTTGAIALSATAYPTPLVPAIIPDGIPSLTVTSTTFKSGSTIPTPNVSKGCGTGPNTSQADDISPQISWSAGPAGTASYVVTMFDADAPTGVGFWHWIVFNIPPTATSLELNATKNMPAGAIRGYGDAGVSAYHGPCPPAGDTPHHYYITVSAMDKMFTGFGPGAGGARITFLQGKAAKILARGQMVGLYGR